MSKPKENDHKADDVNTDVEAAAAEAAAAAKAAKANKPRVVAESKTHRVLEDATRRWKEPK